MRSGEEFKRLKQGEGYENIRSVKSLIISKEPLHKIDDYIYTPDLYFDK